MVTEEAAKFKWHENTQKIVQGHQDVTILCTSSSSGEVVSCQTSSLLLAAYSSVLRQTFNVEEESSVIFCHDFSQECVQAVIEFLTFGKSQSISDAFLAAELYSLLQCWNVQDFTMDGYKPVWAKSCGEESKSSLEKLSRISGLSINARVKTEAATPSGSNGPGDNKTESNLKLERLSHLSGITISSSLKKSGFKRSPVHQREEDFYHQPLEASYSQSEDSDTDNLPLAKKRKKVPPIKRKVPGPNLKGVQITVQPKPRVLPRSTSQTQARPKKRLLTEEEILERVKDITPSKTAVSSSEVKPAQVNLRCDICEKYVGDAKVLDMHLQKHVAQQLECLSMGDVDRVRPMYRTDWFLNQVSKDIPWNNGASPCSYCGQAFDNLRVKADHLVQHWKDLKASLKACSACGEDFESVEIFVKHQRMHHNVCYLCGKTFRWSKSYIPHLVCHITELIGADASPLTDNKLVMDPNSKYGECLCVYCKVPFATADSLLAHTRPHVVEAFNGVTYCRLCNHDFQGVKEYFGHLSRHASDMIFECRHCNSVFTRDRALKNHAKDCQRQEMLVCDLCGFKTKFRKRFNEHKRMHQGYVQERKLKCPTCHVYVPGQTLANHFRTEHDGVMPYICEFCPKSFHDKSKLMLHRRSVHEDLANYRCGICNELFKIKSTINKHIGSHFNKAYRRCTVCLLEFTCEATGYIHIKKVHDGKGSIRAEIPEELKEMRRKYIIKIEPEKLERGEAPRRQTRPLVKVV